MVNSLENTLRHFPRPFVTNIELDALLDNTPNSRYGKVKRLLAQGKLMHIRRGLYGLTDTLGYPTLPHPFALAQFIYASSYISLESALSYHKLIPEAVYGITSVCTKRATEFHTPLGVFSYMRLPLENFYTHIELITENNNKFFMATPWKAICDYVFCYKKEWKTLDPLFENLRINHEDLPVLHDKDIEILDEYYDQNRLSEFLKLIKKSFSA